MKKRNLTPGDDATKGDAWTFCAIDADTKPVPAYKIGKQFSPALPHGAGYLCQ